MKLLAILGSACILTGCAAPVVQTLNAVNFIAEHSSKIKGGISYQQMAAIKVSDQDCPRADQMIDYVNQQLKLRGTYGKNPEDLDEEDRAYNEKGHIIIWSLRIGCNNPDRYAQ